MEKTKEIKKIIDYWNAALLCSNDSSTSHADPDVAFVDNVVENRVLDNILTLYLPKDSKRCLDIGAGYGRFTQALSRFHEEVILLEAAPQLYSQLKLRWSNNKHVKCVAGIFETFEDSEQYDLLLASGLLYLYDDQMVYYFIAKCREMVANGGLLVIRDFIAEPSLTMPSAYVEGGSCYYRTGAFWQTCAEITGFELVDIRRSKPQLKLLRSEITLKLLDLIKIKPLIKNNSIIRVFQGVGDWRLTGNDIHTVFLTMRAR